MEDSRQSVATLQSQLDDYRERSRKDLQEAQRNNKDRLVELQRAQNNLKAQQEEVRTQEVPQGFSLLAPRLTFFMAHLHRPQKLAFN